MAKTEELLQELDKKILEAIKNDDPKTLRMYVAARTELKRQIVEDKRVEIDEIKVQNDVDIKIEGIRIEDEKAIRDDAARTRQMDIEEQKLEQGKKDKIADICIAIASVGLGVAGSYGVQLLKNNGESNFLKTLWNLESDGHVLLNHKKYKF